MIASMITSTNIDYFETGYRDGVNGFYFCAPPVVSYEWHGREFVRADIHKPSKEQFRAYEKGWKEAQVCGVCCED